MKREVLFSCIFHLLFVFNSFKHSSAEELAVLAVTLANRHFLEGNHEGTMTLQTESLEEIQLRLESLSIVIAGFLCFIAASISSAGGIGGGGLFIAIFTTVAGLDLRTASGFSAFMVTGGSIANVLCHSLIRIPNTRGKTLINYDIALLSEPCMLLGVSIGVVCNTVFPEWLITILFAVFLAWCTFKTCKTGFLYWKLESESESSKDALSEEGEGVQNALEPLLPKEEECKIRFPWKKLGMLTMVWFSFFVIYLVRGNHSEQVTRFIKPCGVGYWIIFFLQIPLATFFTALILYGKEHLQDQLQGQQVTGHLTRGQPPKKFVFPVMALFAGILGGVFGIGGGMLISPLLLQVGIGPEVTAATCSFMVFFSSIMSAVQYLMLGMEHIETALILAFVCFIGSLLGLLLVQRAIQQYGRASLIIFSVSIVMALSAVFMTSFETMNIWRDYTSGKYMGFKLPC